jgi:hypothetical protein
VDSAVWPEIEACACSDTMAYAAAACASLRAGTPLARIPVIGDTASVERLGRLIPWTRVRTAMPPDAAADAERTDPVDRLLQAVDPPRDPHRVLLVERGAPEAVPAVFFALATGRTVMLTDDLSDYPARLAGARSAILAGPAHRFGKRFLKELLDWAQAREAAARQLGVLTGRNAAHVSEICAKLLIARRRHAAGVWLPDPATTPGAASEFELIAAHGNEIHLNYREDQVLCGRKASFAPSAPDAFDCGRDCPMENRVDAGAVAASAILLMSCDAFSPSEGLAPSDFSLLFRLLDGQPCAVLAPFKHVQANKPLVLMMEAMARTGCTLGEIAHRINARANIGTLPDYGFLVLGDPEITVVGRDGRDCGAVKITETSGAVVVLTELDGGRHAFTATVPALDDAAPLAVLPISANSRPPDIFFALGWSGDAGTMDVTLFRKDPFEPGPFEFAVMPAYQPDDGELERGRVALRRARLLTHIFGACEALATAETALRGLLTMACAFPCPIEFAVGQQIMLNLDSFMAERAADLRRSACDRILEALATRRIWISQEYADLFADLRRAGPAHDCACPHCGNEAVAWAYADRITHLPSRHVSICSRCGIISDVPAHTPLRVAFPTIGRFRTREEPVEVRVTNTADTPAAVSLALQLNEWRTQGLSGAGCRVELEIDAKQTRTHTARLHFPERFHDDILSVQLFLVDQSLDLLFFSQKVQSTVCPPASAGLR